MAVVAQLVERWLVVPDVAGSSPVGRPILPLGSSTVPPGPVEEAETDLHQAVALDVPWVTIVWNDPVNLMPYVTYVFREYFGYDASEAERLMLLVHHEGRAVVATGPREEMERHTEAMHEYGLWATVAKADA
jgi:ATP-dependent Clp protease adaptor protein ClpS